MPTDITDDEWATLTAEAFDTTALLRAVDSIDTLRARLSDSDGGAPPQIRTDLLKLHQVAMAVFNSGSRRQVGALFDLALDLEDQVAELIEALEPIRNTLEALASLYPETLSE